MPRQTSTENQVLHEGVGRKTAGGFQSRAGQPEPLIAVDPPEGLSAEVVAAFQQSESPARVADFLAEATPESARRYVGFRRRNKLPQGLEGVGLEGAVGVQEHQHLSGGVLHAPGLLGTASGD